jgi:hypothetical protein
MDWGDLEGESVLWRKRMLVTCYLLVLEQMVQNKKRSEKLSVKRCHL